MNENPLRRLPAVNSILEQPDVLPLLERLGRETVVDGIRRELDRLREQYRTDPTTEATVTSIAQRVVEHLQQDSLPIMRSVINATGIVLHTNLGRSPMAEVAAQAAYHSARGYLNLELNLQTGKRSNRQDPIREVLCPLLGCESATVVNNCAAATVIVLRALAAGKEVIVSRGQLVEIGGSFRIPEIMGVSGATLREVGTTNITRIGDYEKAITPQTSLLMRIHTSNFRVGGFTKTASLEELVELGRRHQIPVVDDAGSGAMIDFAELGLPGDPVIPDSLKQGADLALFSGDKLLGGPQAGIIVGRRDLIQKIEKDPLMRAFRCDKMTLAALEATLRLYRNPATFRQEVPTLRLLSLTPLQLRPRCDAFAQQLRSSGQFSDVEVREESAFVGGGSLPDLPLPTCTIALRHRQGSEEDFAERLRLQRPAVMARVSDGRLIIDLRCVFEWQEPELLRALLSGTN